MITIEQIEAAKAKVGKVTPVPEQVGKGSFDLDAYLTRYEIVYNKKQNGGGTLYVLDECLFDSSHGKGEASIGQAADGKLFYQCFHNSCCDRTWKDARERISGSEKLDKFLIPGSPGIGSGHGLTAGRACVQEARSSEYIWQEPLLLGDIDVPEIPCDLLPAFLGDFARAVTDAVQTPPSLAVMYSLPVISTCVQKRFEVAPFGDEYTEPLNIWTVTGLEPGTRKTAVKGFFTKPLVDWETEQAEAMKPQIREVNHVRDMNLKRIEHLKTKASKLSDPAEREACLKEIFDVEAEMPDPIAAPQIWCDDSTPERLQGLMEANGERMALLSDEGGIFEIMAGLYSSGRANLNVFLQSHAGAPVRVDRQGRAVTLHRPALTFGLTVQPDVIADLACGDKARFRGNGTLARFLYCMPRSTVGSRDVTKHIRIPEEVKARYDMGIGRLLGIAPVFNEQGRERARILTLTQDALQSWLRFSQAIENRQGPDGDLYSIQDWTSKLPGAALRIAGLFHVVEHGEHVQAISENTITRSLKLCELLIPHAEAAFGLMGADEATSDAKAILRWIVSGQRDSFTQRECLKRHEGRLKKVDRLKKALGIMIERHIISEARNIGTGHRPSTVYQVNPEIYKSNYNPNDKIDKIDKTSSKPHSVDFVDKVYGDEKEIISENEDRGHDVFVPEDYELPDIRVAGGEKWSF